MSEVVKVPQAGLAKSLNEKVSSVLSADQISGFEKAYLIANAISELKTMLTPEYMKPIMAMQGNKLGFKTDKVYDEATVKNCLIEAVLMGVQPFGNQFNIIAGNTYITKEGYGYLLGNMAGLWWEITPQLPRIKPDNSGAAIVMKISWSFNGGTKSEREIDFPIKMNQYMGTDAVIGKGERKARYWLHKTITGSDFGEGDASEYDGKKTVNIDPATPNVTLEQLKSYHEKNQPVLSASTDKNAKRIIKDNETESFDKVYRDMQKEVEEEKNRQQ